MDNDTKTDKNYEHHFVGSFTMTSFSQATKNIPTGHHFYRSKYLSLYSKLCLKKSKFFFSSNFGLYLNLNKDLRFIEVKSRLLTLITPTVRDKFSPPTLKPLIRI